MVWPPEKLWWSCFCDFFFGYTLLWFCVRYRQSVHSVIWSPLVPAVICKGIFCGISCSIDCYWWTVYW